MNLADILGRCALHFGEKKAVVFGDTHFTYRILDILVDRMATLFRDRAVAKGERVSLYLPNCPEWIVAYYGIIRLGAVAVCVSPYYKRDEVRFLFNDSGSKMIVTSEEMLEQMPAQKDIPNVKDILVIEKDIEPLSVLQEHPGTPPSLNVDSDRDDVCMVLYTGGTTGIPKGAMLTHHNILYTAYNVNYHERTVPDDVSLCFLPLNHAFAANHITNAIFNGGGTLVLHKGFEMDEALSSIQVNEITRFYAVPTVYIRILNNPESRRYFSSVNYCFSAGTSLPSEIVREWKAMFGLNMATYNHLFHHVVGSVGTPAGTVEVKIVDSEDKEVQVGETGEILIRGPNVMKGYLNNPEETKRTLRGGWLHSGDIGQLDKNGYLYIVDRIKDMIITGGLNVYPREVEEVLYTHDAVEECAVIGVADKEYGETVKAYVLKKAGIETTEDEIIRFCKGKMASYKAPKVVKFVTDFPKTQAGKILKRELRGEK
jgi:long-chain acyl-CoA synthetase